MFALTRFRKPPHKVSKTLWWFGVIFALALAYRGFYFFEVRQNPLFGNPVIDADQHHAWAIRISAGNLLGRGPDDVFKPYGYPLLVGGIYGLFGPHITIVQWIQFFTGAVSAVLTALIGNACFGRRVGLLAGCVYALYAPCLFFEGQLLSPAFSIFLNLILTLFLIRSCSSWLTIGIVGGLAAGIRPDVLVPFILVCGYRLWQTLRSQKTRGCLKYGIVLAIGFLLIVLPLMLRNYMLTDQWIFFSSNAGINFYTGNSPSADGVSAIPTGLAWEHAVSTIPKELMPQPASTSRWWVSQGLDFIGKNPLAWMKLLLKKGSAFFNGLEFRNNIGYHWFREDIFSLKFPFIQYWPVSALAILGIGLCLIQYRKFPDAIVLVLWIAGYWIVGVMFFMTARFRLPAIPFMMILAVWAVQQFFEISLRKPHFKKTAGGFLLFVLALVITWPGWFDADKGANNRDYINLGNVLRANGKHRQAIDAYDTAQKMAPEDPEAWFLAGTTYLNLGQPEQARIHLEKAKRSYHSSADILLNAGHAYLLTGNRDKAKDHYKTLIALNSTINLSHKRASVARAHLGLWRLSQERNAIEEARQHLEDAWNVDEQTTAEYCLMNGFALIRSATAFQRLAQEEPWNWYPRANLGIAYFKNGQYQQAVEELERSTRLRGALPGVKFYLGLALLRSGKKTEAYHVLKTLQSQLPESALRSEIQHVLTAND